jgi:hypothetical protein
MKINQDRTEALKNIFETTKSLENTSFKLEQSESDEDFKKIKKGIRKNIDIFFNLHDKNKNYCTTLGNNVQDALKKYHVEVVGLKEIFERKDKIEENLHKLKTLNAIGMYIIYLYH